MYISELKGIGEKLQKAFNKAGVNTIDDLLKYYPRNYDIFEQPVMINELENDRVMAIKGIVARNPEVKKIRNLVIVNAYIKDVAGNFIKATWFNALYLKNTLTIGEELIFRGIVRVKNGTYILEHPKVYTVSQYNDKMGEMQPIYPLVSGLTNTIITKSVKQAIEYIKDVEYLPKSIRNDNNLIDYKYAIKNIHFPEKFDDMLVARRRLVFDEFFSFIYTLRKFKEDKAICPNNYRIDNFRKVNEVIKLLPYNLTNAQINVWEDIQKDMKSDKAMNRLIQGDVGSGKTIVAILSLFSVALAGYQGALMTPTEVLARQHYEEILRYIEEFKLDFKVVFLSGSMTTKQKREAYNSIQSDKDVKLIVGTHAIFQEGVTYSNLALVITDEQHRFGVKQREAISKKGNNPHVIVMSATPIPRTLAVIMYGDLDISVINELPSNRLPIKNCVVGEEYRPNAYRFMENQIAQGRQIYVICPTVEYSEAVEGENVIDYSNTLKKIFPTSVNIEYLHGRMKASEKNEIMERFSKNEIQILVSTTVVEVGVNVPNATVMMIENAERFGLAGLHQLRGRVGRGKYQSYCIFLNGSSKKEASKRLDILAKSNDGFYIAGEDLKMRGPGDFFGVRQSGDMEFKLGDVYSDSEIIKLASEVVSKIEDKVYIMNENEINHMNEILEEDFNISGNRVNI